MYDVNDLLLFVKVVEIGSFFHTAQLLKITQPTVARRIKNLETQLGLSLLRVTTREFEVTEMGQQLYTLIKEQSETIDSLLSRVELISKLKNEPQGDVKISVPVIMAMHLISPYVPAFLRKYPHINLTISYLNVRVDLIKGGFDLAIVGYIPNQLNLKIKHVYTSSMKLYCTKAYAKKYGIPKTPEEISQHFVTGYSNIDQSVINKIAFTNVTTGESIVINMPKRVVINSALHSFKFLFSDEVICAIYDDFDPILDSDSVIRVLPEFSAGDIKYYMIRHPQGHDLKTQIVYDFLVDCLKQSTLNRSLPLKD